MMYYEFMTPYGISLDNSIKANAPTIWREYYNTMSGNALIPCEEMTDELWHEARRLLETRPYFSSEPPYDDNGFLLMWYEVDGEQYWLITSWIE